MDTLQTFIGRNKCSTKMDRKVRLSAVGSRQLRGLNDLVMVRVYDQGGEEIDSERCGNVT